MKHFFVIIFSRFYLLLKDDFSAIAVVAYLLSMNVFTIIGYYKIFVQHSSLGAVPLFYIFIIMISAGLFTRFILLNTSRHKFFFKELKQSLIAKSKTGTLVTIAYVIGSFVLMFSIV